MSVKQKIVKYRRDRAVDRVLELGPRLRELRYKREGIDGSVWPSVASDMDREISSLERRVEKARTYLKTTEAL